MQTFSVLLSGQKDDDSLVTLAVFTLKPTPDGESASVLMEPGAERIRLDEAADIIKACLDTVRFAQVKQLAAAAAKAMAFQMSEEEIEELIEFDLKGSSDEDWGSEIPF